MTARPNSQHTNTTGNDTKHQPAPQGQESSTQRATKQAHQHSTAQAEHRNRNSPELHGKPRSNAKKKQPGENAATHESKAPQQQHNTTQHITAQEHKHATQQQTQHKTHHRPQHHTTRRTTNHNTGQHNQLPGGGGGAQPAQTRHKEKHPPAPSAGGVGRPTPHDSHQRQQGEEQRRQHGATGHTQQNRQQNKRARHRQGAPNNRAQAHTGPRRSTRPTTTHTNTPHSPRHTSPALHSQHGTKKKKKRKKTPEKKTNKHAGGEGEKSDSKERGGKDHKTRRPKAPRAGKHGTPETRGAQRGDEKKNGPRNNTSRATPARRGPSHQRATRTATGKGEAHQNAPGRPARPTRPRKHAHAHTHGTQAWHPPTQNRRCRRPPETAPVHRPSPPSKDGRYQKPDASVTGSTHAKHRRARSPRPTPEGPARDNPIAGPRTGTTRSEPNAPASAGASGRHNEPRSWPASACPAQPPSKAGGASPRGGERHHGDGKADRSNESDRTGRGTAHQRGATQHAREARRRPQPRHKGRCQATAATGCRKPGQCAQHATNHGTGTGARKQPTHTPQTPASSGGVQEEHTHQHTQIPTPQQGVAGRSRNPSPNTHTHAAQPSQG